MIKKSIYTTIDIRNLNKLVLYYKKMSQANLRRFSLKNRDFNKNLDITKKYIAKFESVIICDLRNAFSEYKSEINYDSQIPDSLFKEVLIDNACIIAAFEIHIFYRLFKMKSFKEEKISSIQDLENFVSSQKQSCWYRGQTSDEWSLIPSFFRNPKKSYLCRWENVLNEYKSKPRKNPLIEKLSEVNITSVYRTTAFIQHSIGFSPLIDFTKSSSIAISFALANFKNVVDFYGINACIFELNISQWTPITRCENIDEIIESMSIDVIKENESIIQLVNNDRWRSFLNEDGKETSVIHLIDCPTNDRMLFQKGTFVLFDRVLIIGNVMYMSFGKREVLLSKMIKYIIEPQKKEEIYMWIMKNYSQYHQRYLYDPYLYLTEPDI